jgi:hypothetical protein
MNCRDKNRHYFHIVGMELGLNGVIFSILKMEVTCSSETSVYNKPTWCHIPEMAFIVVTAVKTSNPT